MRQRNPSRKTFPQKRQTNSPPSGRTDWDHVAAWYDSLVGESGSDYHKHVVLPGALRLMNVQKDEKILDMGCGQGVFSRLLARAGASVTGVDLSSSLIDAARQRGGGIRYFCNDAVHFTLPREEFDASSFILSIMNMDPLDDTLHHQSKLIRKGGRLLLVLIHPCFRIPRQSSWGFDENKKIQFRRVDRYATSMAIPIQMFPGSRPSETTPTFHRSLQTYSQALAKHGFSITAIEEWTSHRKSEPGPRARAENRAREEFPLFLALLARKDD